MSITRRDLITSSLAAGALSPNAQTATTKSAYYEMRYFRMRNDKSEQPRRTNAFLKDTYLPAAKKAGAGPIGLFGAVIGPDTPFTLCLSSYPSLAAMETARDKLAASEEYQKGLAEYNAGESAFERMDTWILRAFDFFPAIEMLAAEPKRPARIFELRTYDSQNESLLARKIRMFGSGELGIFRKVGAQPLMFGEAIAGSKLPHLSYMLGFEDLATREKAWKAFGADPDWVKLRSSAEFSVPGMVINISNSILNVINGSEIR
jgi:hypothetical protein